MTAAHGRLRSRPLVAFLDLDSLYDSNSIQWGKGYPYGGYVVPPRIQARGCILIRNVIISVTCSILIGLSASADIPHIISYQGKVTDTAGNPIPDGFYLMQFKIFDAPTGNILLWSSGDVSVDVIDGIFSVLLGKSPQPSLDLEFDQDYWLEVVVESVVQSPRQQLVSAGYAYMSSGLVPGTEAIGEVTNGMGSAFTGVNTALTGVTYGLRGESNSTAGVGVYGEATATSGFTYGGRFHCDSPTGRGVYGFATSATGEAYGIHGTSSSTNGVGVFGEATATTGNVHGVHGISSSPLGIGVWGHNTSLSGYSYGVYGQTDSSNGIAVLGSCSSSTGWTAGVFGSMYSTEGAAIYGRASSTIGTNYGVYGESFSSSGVGVYGYTSATSGSNYGVYGESPSTAGRGVSGIATAISGFTIGGSFGTYSPNGRGVYGYALDDSETSYGVYGESFGTIGFGVYYSGGLAGTGPKSCVVKTSQGPTLMYCQESPENWFEDFGEGQLIDGRCHIDLDPLFLETVTIDESNPMKVFVEVEAEYCNGVAIKRGDTGFDVIERHGGTTSSPIWYRVVAKRKGFESKRLDYCKAAETDSYLYPELREKELEEIDSVRARIESIPNETVIRTE